MGGWREESKHKQDFGLGNLLSADAGTRYRGKEEKQRLAEQQLDCTVWGSKKGQRVSSQLGKLGKSSFCIVF